MHYLIYLVTQLLVLLRLLDEINQYQCHGHGRSYEVEYLLLRV